MQLQFIGCGDAFGSGGRFNTCFHVTGERANFLIDCGASSLIAMKKLGIDRNGIQAIFITHFHADHFGGLPFFMLDSQFFTKRTAPSPHRRTAWPGALVRQGAGDRFPRIVADQAAVRAAPAGVRPRR